MSTAKELIEKIENVQDYDYDGVYELSLYPKERDALLSALKQGEWVSVEDGLPEMKQLVLVYGILNKEVGKDDTEKSIGLVMWNVPMASDCKDEDQYSMWYTNITHWLPLPTPPTES